VIAERDRPMWGKTSHGESWHIADERIGDEPPQSLCGHPLVTTLQADFKASEKTCESCLRIHASEE
jgi:hypothetical protein